MTRGLKQRLIGAVVILALVIIFLPMLLQGPVERTRVDVPIKVPPEPVVSDDGTLPPPDFNDRPTPGTPTDDAGGASSEASSSDGGERSSSDGGEASGNAASEVTADGGATDDTGGSEPPQGRPVSWVVQVGAFSEVANAEQLRERLRGAGFDAVYSERSRADGEVVHRVRLGPLVSRSDARALAERLQRDVGLDGILVPQ